MYAPGIILLALTVSPLLAAPVNSVKLHALHRREPTLTLEDAKLAKQWMAEIEGKLANPQHLGSLDSHQLGFIKAASQLKVDSKAELPNEYRDLGSDAKAFFKKLRKTRQAQIKAGTSAKDITDAKADLLKIDKADPKTKWKEVMKPVGVVGAIGGTGAFLYEAQKGRKQTVADGNGDYYIDHVDHRPDASQAASAPQRRRSLSNTLEELD
ncbi:hypothetical protein FRB96_003264 [Tulasnella sp. 330]|nr:hypothetical protein FRB96_003264 [Tulasnella sp. 330]KAG8883945.1 hypothetical protein FRB98_002725 [Tulasnella sp. 332]